MCWLPGPCLLCVHMQGTPHCGAFVALICPLSSDINMLPCLLQADSANPTTANKGQGVSFRGSSSTAPSLQVNVDFERAADKVGEHSTPVQCDNTRSIIVRTVSSGNLRGILRHALHR